jgi:UrcA family protein
MPRSAHIALVSAAALALAAPAFAQSQPESRLVTYGELNLDSAAGADALIRRIDNAAGQVCGRHEGRTNTRQAYINRACQVESTENGVADVNHPVVMARYYGSGYAVIEPDTYDPRLDPSAPEYDPTLDPNSPYYDPK